MKKKNKIKIYQQKDELEIEKIVNEYSGYVYKIIKNQQTQYLSNEDVEEIVLDTFYILWRNKGKLDEDKLLSSYIAGITRNLIKEKTRSISINVDIEDYQNIIQDNFKVDMICEEREKISIIEKTLKNMKKQDIEIFKLYYYNSMKIKEISKKLNIKEFNIKSRLYRMRKKIEKELIKGGYGNHE